MQTVKLIKSLLGKIVKILNFKIINLLNYQIASIFYARNVRKCTEMSCFYGQFFYNVFTRQIREKVSLFPKCTEKWVYQQGKNPQFLNFIFKKVNKSHADDKIYFENSW